jgi:hypothetical protein
MTELTGFMMGRQLKLANLVTRQADDEGLWVPPQTPIEAYLQKALRVLHAAIDGEPDPHTALGEENPWT